MTVNNSIRVIIALQQEARWRRLCCRDDGMAIKNKRSADQGTNADLTGVVTWETWRLKAGTTRVYFGTKYILDWWIGNPLGLCCDTHSFLCAVWSATCYFLKFASPLSPPRPLIRTSQMSRLYICNSKLARSNVITLFCHPQIWISQWVCWEEEGEKKETCLTSLKNQCLSTALRSSLTGKGIHTHLAAIVGSKKTNHNIIDVLKKEKKTTTDDSTIDNLCSHPERKS